MEEPAPLQSTVRGKDLPGAVKVMPLGLDAAIKKRVSGEFRSEKSGSSLAFAHGTTQEMSSSHQVSSNQMMSSMTSSTSASSSWTQKSSSTGHQMTSDAKAMTMSSSAASSSFKSDFSSETSSFGSLSAMQKSHQELSSSHQMMSSSKQLTSSVSSSSTKSVTSAATKSISFDSSVKDFAQVHGQEIQQDNLKSQIQSAIVDLETEIPQDFKENIAPASIKSPTPVNPYFSQKEDYFSPPPLEPVLRRSPSPAPQLQPLQEVVSAAPALQIMQNGFAEFSRSLESKQQISSSSMVTSSSSSTNFTSTTLNGSALHHEESAGVGHGLQESGSGGSLVAGNNSLLQKILTPAPQEYDSGSLRRRDPRKMFTDSSFYNAKHHPTVADQVEMAHRISSALFKEENRTSKGQQMYINRLKKSGEEQDADEDVPRHDPVPNLKLVMNPEGKVHEWSDLDPRELPDPALLAGHALPSLPSPDIVNPVVGDLANSVGKGEPQRCPNNSSNIATTFVSAYRRVFDANRGVFGSADISISPGGGASPKDSPRFERRQLPQQVRDMYNNNYVNKLQLDGRGTKAGSQPVRPFRQSTVGGSKAAVGSGGQSPKVLTSPSALVKPFTIGTDVNKEQGQPVILPRLVTAKLKETPKKVSLDLSNQQKPQQQRLLPQQQPHHQQQKQIALQPECQLFRTPSGLPDLIPEQRPYVPCITADRPFKPEAADSETTTLGKDINNKPTDVVLRTPYLLEPPASRPAPLIACGQVDPQPPRFPQIAGNSIVAKTKALFEERQNLPFLPIKRSRTFSTFPSGAGESYTPSPPQRSTSRRVATKVVDEYKFKSMNSEINQCGLESNLIGVQLNGRRAGGIGESISMNSHLNHFGISGGQSRSMNSHQNQFGIGGGDSLSMNSHLNEVGGGGGGGQSASNSPQLPRRPLRKWLLKYTELKNCKEKRCKHS